ncbi:MAG: hypothetical protein BWY10_02514 [Chloroflexi bacterium ADurb.Bin180]|nr:MAG: hypothetical protein BWY10_02514 [Chloroflexi bacterium ADurb.Bin180]
MSPHPVSAPRVVVAFLLSLLGVLLVAWPVLWPGSILAAPAVGHVAAVAKCPDAYEPNNDFYHAPQLDVNTSYSAAICDSSDVDYYAFFVDSGYHLRAAIYSLPTDFDLDLFDSNYTLVGSSNNAGTEDDVVNYDVWKGGLFYMAVHGKKGEFSDTIYKFILETWYPATATPTFTTVPPSPTPTATPTATDTRTPTPTTTLLCPDGYEYNNTFDTAREIGPGDLLSYICEPTDLDWYQFRVEFGDTVEAWLLNLPKDYDLFLYDAGANEQARSQTGGLADEYVAAVDVKVAGYWRVLVGTAGDFSRTQPYKLRLRITHGVAPTPTPTQTLPPCNSDPSEPNDSFAAARLIYSGGWTQGYICPSSDVDFFRFAVAAGQMIRLELASLPADYDLFLWSPAGVEVEHSWRSGLLDELIVYRALVSGEYRAEVRPVYGQWHGTDPYDLRLDVYGETPTPTRTRAATLTPTRTLTPSPTMFPGLDLTIQYIEVNQAIQTNPPMFDPIWGKPTVVRVYVSTGLPPGSPCVPGVWVRLDVLDQYGGGTPRYLFPYNPGGVICAPATPDWHNLNDSLNFDLPADLLQGAWTLLPVVNLDHSVIESNYDNNRNMAQLIRFRPIAKRISIAYVPIHYTPEGYTGPQDPTSRIIDAVSYLKATWPVRPDYVRYWPVGGFTWTKNVNSDDNDVELLEYITRMQENMTSFPADHLYGWLPDSAFGGNGLGWLGSSLTNFRHAAFGNDTYGSPTNSRYRRTLSHELQHNYGFDHPQCTTLNGRGFDVLGRQVKSDTMLAVMCAGQPEYVAWADRDSYNRMYSVWDTGFLLEESARVTSAAPLPYVIASGLVCNRQGVISGATLAVSGELSPLEQVQRYEVIPPPTGSAYCLDFHAAGGAVLQTVCFDPVVSRDSLTTSDCAPFGYTLPWPAGTVRAVLRAGTTTLDERTLSAHLPSVRILSPNAGETWDGRQTITWLASDADSDPLTFTVLYSRDNGSTWLPLAVELDARSLAVDTTKLGGGTSCLIQVRASDGFSSTEDTSDAPFSVPNRPPLVTIDSPRDEMWFRPVETINLMGQAWDPEDGAIAEDDLVWYLSTYSGSTTLGHGSLLSVGPLPEGDHLIVLDVMDSSGTEAIDSVTIHVGERVANALCVPLVVKRR